LHLSPDIQKKLSDCAFKYSQKINDVTSATLLQQTIIKHVVSKVEIIRIPVKHDMLSTLRSFIQPKETRGAELMLKMKANLNAGRSAVLANRSSGKHSSKQGSAKTSSREKSDSADSAKLLDCWSLCRNTDNIPFIPGSSVKGAIRSAVLSLLLEEDRSSLPKDLIGRVSNRPQEEQSLLEGFLLRGEDHSLERRLRPEEDPFAGLLISDFLPIQTNGISEIRYACRKNKDSRASFENSKSVNDSESLLVEVMSVGTVLSGYITFDPNHAHSYHVKNQKTLFTSITPTLVQLALNRLAREVPVKIDTIQAEPLFLQIGAFGSHANSVLFMKGGHRGNRSGWVCGKTKEITQSHIPFGWVQGEISLV
jgi:hypothetical protein